MDKKGLTAASVVEFVSWPFTKLENYFAMWNNKFSYIHDSRYIKKLLKNLTIYRKGINGRTN
jgi:hypothetical protein